MIQAPPGGWLVLYGTDGVVPGWLSQASGSSTYLGDVDGLRALAILTVLIFHAFPVVTGHRGAVLPAVPLLLWLVVRARSPRARIALFVGLTAAGFAINVARVGSDPAATYFLPHYRFWELTSGALVAHSGRRSLCVPCAR